jgi:hypothetical protein
MILLRRVFDEFSGDYDNWFDEHMAVYEDQVRMLRGIVPRARTLRGSGPRFYRAGW